MGALEMRGGKLGAAKAMQWDNVERALDDAARSMEDLEPWDTL